MDNTQALLEALEAAQDFINDVHYGKWTGPWSRRNEVQAKLARGFAAIFQPPAPEQASGVPQGQYLIRYNSDGEFGQATGWLYRDGGDPCVVTGKPVYVWRPMKDLVDNVNDREFWLSVCEGLPSKIHGFQGGLSNDDLVMHWHRKVRNSSGPTDEQLTGFALGIEVGVSLSASPAALEAAPQQQAQGEPEVVATVDGDEASRRMIWRKDFAAFDLAVGCELITMRSHREAIALKDEQLAELDEAWSKKFVKLRAALDGCVTVIKRYRNETPLGHQPHMIAHVADAAITQAKEAL